MGKRERNLGCLLGKTSRLIKWELNDKLKEHQLTSAQWRVLMDLRFQEEIESSDTTPAQIAERLNVERPAVTRTIDGLIKDDWVVREENLADRRSHIIKLTEKSKEFMPRFKAISEKVMGKTLQGFQEEEIEQLRFFLIRIIDNFN
ncbi:MarR family winged helix-turn-helix transcriptional regulator [Clostridium formicaceticum]|uniref:Transcriptional regulator SlyA n=1 Tax=Clostridium formicaceticum TaxID=1497 RepID=A0AAC9WHQ1_9CLOT|nr:MarR family transcriptional regulator [Clostridium formicaceticum]AOY74930.1 hypothetical protein BJL90_02515 [Clostridium formicaceticum]ARE89337.1 Transcriptional regulator SlyA [Clostridium formicaceticum]